MSNCAFLKIEITTRDGKIYKQPNCLIKTDSNGYIMCLVREDENDSWRTIKGEVKINEFIFRKEYYIHKNKTKIPMWLIKLFGVKF